MNYQPLEYLPISQYQNPYVQSQNTTNTHNNEEAELNHLKRSLGCLNLVQTRKNQNSRYKWAWLIYSRLNNIYVNFSY